jgi:tetrahydromethanopterin S-methyltransferase subunit E
MPPTLRSRFWLEAVLGAITGLAAITTVFWRDWIEVLFGVDPDSGSGAVEWLTVVGQLFVAILLTAGARRDWRRARAAESAA